MILNECFGKKQTQKNLKTGECKINYVSIDSRKQPYTVYLTLSF